MSAVAISFLFALGAGAWVYRRFQRTTGNNTQKSLIASGITGAVLFLVLYTILGVTL